MKSEIVIGTRGSQLALWQAEHVRALIKDRCPACRVTLKKIKTTGDIQREQALDRMDSKGVFTKELEEELLAGSIDLAVHSLKDMPTEITPGLTLAGFLERADPRDTLVLRGGMQLADLGRGLRLGCGSPRRINQLLHLFPKTTFANIRGNIDTRIRKATAADGEFDGTLLARAALDRLGLTAVITHTFTLEEMVPAAGQGIICLETRTGATGLDEIIGALNHPASARAAAVERGCLKRLAGGCSVPFGIHARVAGARLETFCFLSDPQRAQVIKQQYDDPLAEPEQISARISADLIRRGADTIVAAVRNGASPTDNNSQRGG